MRTTTATRPLNSKRRLGEAESLLRTIVPEWRHSPLTLMNMARDFPRDIRSLAFTFGMCIDNFHFDAIQANGGWPGPHCVIVFCRRIQGTRLFATTIHEAAHQCIAGEPFEPSSPEVKSAQSIVLREHLSKSPASRPETPAWYAGHDLPFIRRCLHLHHRAWAAGVEVGMGDIGFAGPYYQLSPHWRYARALGDEPARLADATLDEINATLAPAEFLDLWCQDVDRWFAHSNRISKTTDRQLEITNVSPA